MNKFMIIDSVDTEKIPEKDILIEGAKVFAAAANNLSPLAALGYGFGGALADAMIKKISRDTAVAKITTVEELEQYRNCTSGEWKTNVLYVEHPHRKRALIEATLYKDYILREMVADITNYISDNLDLSNIVIGMITTKKGKAKFSVPVKEVNPSATIQCNLDSNYMMALRDTHACPDCERSYFWIGQFPDVQSAIEHQSGGMEIRKAINLDLDVETGLAGKFSAAFGTKNSYEFYITYTKAQ